MSHKLNDTSKTDQKMNKQSKNSHQEVTLEQAIAEETVEVTVDKTAQASKQKPKAKPDPDEGFTLIEKAGKAHKLNPKIEGLIFYQTAKKDGDGQLYLRLDKSEGGGLHSREWIALSAIIECLKDQKDANFNSTLLKKVIVGKSQNNAGFLAGVLRSEGVGLIKPSPDGIFLHQLADNFEEQAKALLALV